MSSIKPSVAQSAAPPPECRELANRSSLRSALTQPHPVIRRSLGQLLAATRAVDASDVRSALALQKSRPGTKLGDLLLESGKVKESDLYRALGEQMGVPFAVLRDFDVEPEALSLLPQEVVRTHRVLPLMIHDGQLVVATDDPADND